MKTLIKQMKRAHGCFATYEPTRVQVDLIRRKLSGKVIENDDGSLIIDTGAKIANTRTQHAQVLFQRLDGQWVLLIHHLCIPRSQKATMEAEQEWVKGREEQLRQINHFYRVVER